MTAHSPERTLLFISYAYEDKVFAYWLARKLALNGYGVWIDELKILGGESWVKDVDVAIKEKTFRMLAILSKDSIDKPHPRKERTLALQVGQQLGISDFLITLNLDGTQPDWTLSDISWRSFNEGWATGLKQLLKKLRTIEAPRIHEGNPAIAAAGFDDGQSLLKNESEKIVSNWLTFQALPQKLRVYKCSDLPNEKGFFSKANWACYTLNRKDVVSFYDPPESLRRWVSSSREEILWQKYDYIREIPTQHIVSNLVYKIITCSLVQKGCRYSPSSKAYYLPDPWKEEGIVRFVDFNGSKTHIFLSGKVTIPRLAMPPEIVIYHPAIRLKVRTVADWRFIVQIRPTVVIFDANHAPITGRNVGPRIKRVTKQWWNEKWRKRLMAFTELTQSAVKELHIEGLGELNPTILTADICLDESLLETKQEHEEKETTSDVLLDEEDSIAENGNE